LNRRSTRKQTYNVSKVKELIEERLSGKARDGAEGQNHINEDIKEFRESEARRNNIIIFNVNESEARKQEDTDCTRIMWHIESQS
jgi:hypothetical protein